MAWFSLQNPRGIAVRDGDVVCLNDLDHKLI
jgi:hypothetical protein